MTDTFITDTRQLAIGSTSQYGHRWYTQSILIDIWWPGFGWSYSSRLPDGWISSGRYVRHSYQWHGAAEVIV